MSEVLRRLLREAGPAGAEQVTWRALSSAARLLAFRMGLSLRALESSRFARLGAALGVAPEPVAASEKELDAAVEALIGARLAEGGEHRQAAHVLGALLDELLALRMQLEGAASGQASTRRRHGSFFTPESLCATVAERALGPLLSADGPLDRLRVADPAVGGGAFLIECGALLAEAYRRRGHGPEEARRQAVKGLFGVDRSELAVAITELSLWLYVADPCTTPSDWGTCLACGDALCGAAWKPDPHELPPMVRAFDWHAAFPDVGPDGFDLVIGNPPWVAFAGRSAQALPEALRSYFRRRFESFAGFPTLHALFVERAAELAPKGRLALLLPSPLADLDGYRAARGRLTKTHRLEAPLCELGPDAFEGVVQPSFVLVADAHPALHAEGASDAAWPLAERGRADVTLTRAPPPRVLARIGSLPPLPASTFREIGFQSNREVTERLFWRGDGPKAAYDLPLLEGRNVREFAQDPPRLFLCADPALLRQAGSKLRPLSEYRKVDFVVRQTAAVTIAARHSGYAFRNSLLAGYANADLDADLLVALLNSSLFRALHLARQRDARQIIFPQVKIGHLRGLPMPPAEPELRARIAEATRRASLLGVCTAQTRIQLDAAVGELFGLAPEEQEAVARFVETKSSPRKPCLVGDFVEPRGIEPLTS